MPVVQICDLSMVVQAAMSVSSLLAMTDAETSKYIDNS